jgi:DNA-binding transcriptional regulator WhiA
MRASWNKGLTKATSKSVKKISLTMRKKKIDNFSEWREKMKKAGKIKSVYKRLKKDGDLAELTGVILGDGHIGIFPRTECLLIFSNTKNKGFIMRYSDLIEKIFDKKPAVRDLVTSNCTRICIYEKYISERLKIPKGARLKKKFLVPKWILKNNDFVLRYLRGLYEAEGNFSVHKPTYTYKMFFSNNNQSLKNIVFELVTKLGFHPNMSGSKVQISRKKEVYDFIELISFRKY